MKIKKNIKTLLFVSVLTIIIVGSLFLSFAHPGNTDENGGHYDRSTGEYHYHHGYPAHQHINGECPYNFVDNTDHSGGSSYYSEKDYQSWYAEYQKEQEEERQERERIERDKAQGTKDGEAAGSALGESTGKEDGENNSEYKLPKLYTPLYADDNYTYQYASSEYKHAFEQGFESAYKEAYESGYQSGHALWQEKHDKTVRAIIWLCVLLLALFVLICYLVHRHRKKQKAKIRALAKKLKVKRSKLRAKEVGLKAYMSLTLFKELQDIKEWRFALEEADAIHKYEGKSYNELLPLPKGVYYYEGSFRKRDNPNAFVVYKNVNANVLHSKKGCSRAYNEYSIFRFSGDYKYSMCLRCGTAEHDSILLKCPPWYEKYIEINAIVRKYNIKLDNSQQLELPLE